jgi:hypothetical protein
MIILSKMVRGQFVLFNRILEAMQRSLKGI